MTSTQRDKSVNTRRKESAMRGNAEPTHLFARGRPIAPQELKHRPLPWNIGLVQVALQEAQSFRLLKNSRGQRAEVVELDRVQRVAVILHGKAVEGEDGSVTNKVCLSS